MAAYLADDDAGVYNLIEAAVREDAVTAALHLTGLAADAVAELAAATKTRPAQVLRSLVQGPLSSVNHSPKRQPEVQIVYPGAMDEHDWAMTEAKGWIEITLRSAEGDRTIPFYDPVRLAQDVVDATTGTGYFAASAVVVIPAVTREAIEAVVARIAERGYTDIIC
ncbi:hypothetical protein [Actinoplanes sp. RD1]|uniref:hypothetical protein n=1 Tax=Actinoplanes sp. RD1 TaxID=3064538 RepID=UPI0027425BE1|nr:hypothetical protein [Actinoplanes sp. RD1]